MRAVLGLFALLVFGVLAAGCGGVSAPEGWAGPKLSEDGKTLYVTIERGRMAALDSVPEAGADCRNAADDDNDRLVNEGCPQEGSRPERGGDCENNSSDERTDSAADDDAVNDGCPPFAVRWVFPPEGDNDLKLDGIYAAPVEGDEAVYFGAYDDDVYALDRDDGSLLWFFETNDPIVAALTLVDPDLYVASTDGRLYVIDTTQCAAGSRCPDTAAVTFDTRDSIWGSPLVTETAIYVPTMSGRLHALDPETLQEVDGFNFETNAGLLMDPTLANDDTLLVGGIDGELFALDPKTGAELWNNPLDGDNWFWGKPLIEGDVAYIPNLGDKVYAVNLSDGSAAWPQPFTTERGVRSAPLLVNDVLVVVDDSGKVYGLDPENGNRVTEWPATPVELGGTVLSDPLLVEDQLLIVKEGGDVCRLDPSDGSPASGSLCAEVRL